MSAFTWHVIVAGGAPRTAFAHGAWFVPMFRSHDACSHWWREYCKANKEDRPWAITDKQRKGAA